MSEKCLGEDKLHRKEGWGPLNKAAETFPLEGVLQPWGPDPQAEGLGLEQRLRGRNWGVGKARAQEGRGMGGRGRGGHMGSPNCGKIYIKFTP